MADFTVRVQKMGRIVIPKVTRDVEGIAEGDYVSVSVVKVEKKE